MALLGPVFGGERENPPVACRRADEGSGVDAEGDLTLRQIRGMAEGVVDVLRRRGDMALTWADGREPFGWADADAGGLVDGPHRTRSRSPPWVVAVPRPRGPERLSERGGEIAPYPRRRLMITRLKAYATNPNSG
jgi:hypothetical protein